MISVILSKPFNLWIITIDFSPEVSLTQWRSFKFIHPILMKPNYVHDAALVVFGVRRQPNACSFSVGIYNLIKMCLYLHMKIKVTAQNNMW